MAPASVPVDLTRPDHTVVSIQLLQLLPFGSEMMTIAVVASVAACLLVSAEVVHTVVAADTVVVRNCTAVDSTATDFAVPVAPQLIGWQTYHLAAAAD